MTEDELPTVTATCCRDWPVVIGVQIGRCGYCGERPEIKNWAWGNKAMPDD